ncbi:MAG TPA: hypothetical protein DCY13_10885, partial [Verrucomicrobiales bacterium]|nr:hypothetical protein [Verrucomicrobiales bacterium]
VRINERTTLEIRPAAAQSSVPLLDIKAGSAYFLNRTRPMDSRFTTPTVSGAIRGTEFLLEVAGTGATTISMFEGEVALSSPLGELGLRSGEQAVIETESAPRRTAVIVGQQLIQWALYYPAILRPEDVFGDQPPAILKESLAAYRSGDLHLALQRSPAFESVSNDAERTYLAALLLSVGQVEQSRTLLGNSTSRIAAARGVQLLIDTVTNVDGQPKTDPSTATEWLAVSYHLQSQHDLPEALAAARKATELAPNFGFGWVRVAELEFGSGNNRRARAALETGLVLSSENAQAVALQGFLLVAEGRSAAAVPRFEQAMQLDSGLGNAWLGRGLTRFHEGDREGGRADLQVAAALEPQRSVLRSYLGKGFFEVGDVKHAEKELEIAAALDPNDPTPLLYSALLRQKQNRINEAISDLQESQRLNDNRALYRSRSLLDQDQSVRSANQAALYRDNGMVDLSVREAARSVNLDYANHSAHLFLANSYDALRDPRQINLRYETPWLSELLVANLLSPVNAGALSQTVSQQEYARLFAGDHLGFSSSTEYQSRGDWLQYGSLYGSYERTGFALDAVYRDLSGDAPNTDVRLFDLSAKLKQQFTSQDSILFQAIYSDYESGDPRQYYDPADASATLRVREKQEPNVFAGYHREWKPGAHTLFLAGRLDDDFRMEDSAGTVIITTRNATNGITRVDQRTAPTSFDSQFTAYTFELQQIHQVPRHTVIAGARHQTGDLETDSLIQRGSGIQQSIDPDLTRSSAYAYYSWEVLETLQLTGGIAYDRLEYPVNGEIAPLSTSETSEEQWSPKAGIRWQPWAATTLRGAYTRSLGGVFYDNSVRLEPTQVAGFNQAFRSLLPESTAGLVPGSSFETLGVAWDQRIDSQTYLTVSTEMLESGGERVVGTLDAFGPLLTDIPSGTRQFLDFRERTLSVTLDRMIGKHLVLGATYRLSEAELDDRVPEVPLAWSASFSPTANRSVSATMHQLDVHSIFNHSCGAFAEIYSLWTQQSNEGYATNLPGDDFWQFNAFIGYRFPRRLAEVRAGILNLTDRDYRLNPLNLHSQLPRERTLLVSLKLNF